MAVALIEYNSSTEVMSITKSGECVFYGSYSEFDKSPHGLRKIFHELGINAVLRENKGLGEIHPDELHEDYE